MKEYKVVRCLPTKGKLRKKTNKLAEKGFEVVSTCSGFLLFFPVVLILAKEK